MIVTPVDYVSGHVAWSTLVTYVPLFWTRRARTHQAVVEITIKDSPTTEYSSHLRCMLVPQSCLVVFRGQLHAVVLWLKSLLVDEFRGYRHFTNCTVLCSVLYRYYNTEAAGHTLHASLADSELRGVAITPLLRTVEGQSHIFTIQYSEETLHSSQLHPHPSWLLFKLTVTTKCGWARMA